MKKLSIGHSPDADDAFMFYGLASGRVKVEGYAVDHVLEDIESLNRRARGAELDVTAISAAAYPTVAPLYRIMSCGASVGRRYGPIVLARTALTMPDLKGRRVAVPGEHTTAYLLFRLYMPAPFEPVIMDFEAIMASRRASCSRAPTRTTPWTTPCSLAAAWTAKPAASSCACTSTRTRSTWATTAGAPWKPSTPGPWTAESSTAPLISISSGFDCSL
jgi:hypothetical protein